MSKKAVLTKAIVILLMLSCRATICMEEVDIASQKEEFPFQSLPQDIQEIIWQYVTGNNFSSLEKTGLLSCKTGLLKYLDSKELKPREQVTDQRSVVSLNKGLCASANNSSRLGINIFGENGKEVSYQLSGVAPVSAISFVGEGKIFSCHKDGEIFCLGLNNDNEDKLFKRVGSGGCKRIRSGPENSIFVCSNFGIQGWLETGQCICVLHHDGKNTKDFAFRPNYPNKVVACAYDTKNDDGGAVYFWDWKHKSFEKSVPCKYLPTTLDVNERDEVILGDKNGKVILYDIKKKLFKEIGSEEGEITNIRFLGGRLVITTSLKKVSDDISHYGGLSVLDMDNGEELLKLGNIRSFDYDEKGCILVVSRGPSKSYPNGRLAKYPLNKFKLVTDWLAKGCPVRRSLVLNKEKYQMDYAQYAILLVKIDKFLNSNKENKLELSGTEQIYFNALPKKIRIIFQRCIDNKQKDISQSKKCGSRGCAIM